MQSYVKRIATKASLGLALAIATAPSLAAQGRVVLPKGSVILVKTTTALESNVVRAGQTFETIVSDTVMVDNSTVIPAGSRIRGVVSVAQPATRQKSGVIQVSFDRLTLPGGASFELVARLTSTDSAERRQIDADTNSRVVLIGARGGVGAAIAGASAGNSSTSGLLAALGGLLSEGRDVKLAAGTPLAVQLDESVILRSRGTARGFNASAIYTSADRVRAAQQKLAEQNYYRGSINGLLDDATHRALFQFQADQGFLATGNLDGRTAQALGVADLGTTVRVGTALSATEASTSRRAAQSLVGQQRQDLSISQAGRLSPRRSYTDGELDLWFALSAFADNASLYEQVVRAMGSPEGLASAGKSLIAAARRVDAALLLSRPSSDMQSAWVALQAQLNIIDPTYGRN